MARQRTPAQTAKITGRTLRNPKRYARRTSPLSSLLGPAPNKLTAAERKVWAEFAAELPWLRASDRKILAVACRLAVRAEGGPDLNLKAMGELRRTLAALGATPADRSKIYAPEEEDVDDPAREFVN